MVKKKIEDEYQDVDLKLIDEPDGRIRLELDEEEIESLADNIREVGQIQPINLAIKGKRYEIIAGHLRYLAIKKLGRKTIKAIIKDIPRKEIALVRASENMKRTNLTPIEEGAIYVDLVKEYKLTKKEIARKFGVAPSGVKFKMDLLRLEPEIQRLIHAGLIYINVGIELNQIDDERERRKCLRDAVNNGCSIESARIWVQDYRKSSTYESPDADRGSPLEEQITTQKIYQACEVCENPIEIQDMKIIRICRGCYKIIVENLKQGG
jgi:ParB family chromosome partitioning protein